MIPCALTIDGGLATMGVGVVELGAAPADDRIVELRTVTTAPSAKKLRTLAADDGVRRVGEIVDVLDELLEAHRVVVLTIEAFSAPRNASAAAKMGFSYGAVVALARSRRIPIAQATPMQIKRAACGSGTATKDEVGAGLVRRYGADLAARLLAMPSTLREHAADALGAFVACHDAPVILVARQLRSAA